jgi:3-phosphoshikimate 1-carboxyvinyltransferase
MDQWRDRNTRPKGGQASVRPSLAAAARDTIHAFHEMRIERARAFRGRFAVPGDKSISHRLAILGAVAEGDTWIDNFSSAADCASTLACLQRLGVHIQRAGARVGIRGHGFDGLKAPEGPLDAGNSGSTLRMLAGVLAGRPFRSVLTGDDSLRRRPVERVAAPLRAMGARAQTVDGKPPLTLDGGNLRGIRWESPVASAQVKTAVLLAGLQAAGTTTVIEPTPSRDHTERLLAAFGAPVQRDGLAVSVHGGRKLRPAKAAVPGDASSAAFLVVAALILPDSEVRIEGVLLNPQRVAFVDVLRDMGGEIETGLVASEPEPVGWMVARSSALHGTTVAPAIVAGLIDEVPALAVAAACAEGDFVLTGAAELRVKESDRIAALAEGLTRLGASVEELPDGLVVHGGRPLHGAVVRSHGDHRIAMALAVAGLVAEGATEIEDAECASVSFPEFYAFLERGAAAG